MMSTQLLESADDADARVRRVLELLRHLVPYEQCAMLEARLGHEPRVVLVPETSSDERAAPHPRRWSTSSDSSSTRTRAPRALAGRSEEAHLAVPLVGLDEVIGMLLVRSSATEYTEEHLRALSVVAAKLAAYITLRGASAELAELARERDEARRAAEARPRREGRAPGAGVVGAQDTSPLRRRSAPTTSWSRRSRRRPSASTTCSARRASRPRSCA